MAPMPTMASPSAASPSTTTASHARHGALIRGNNSSLPPTRAIKVDRPSMRLQALEEMTALESSTSSSAFSSGWEWAVSMDLPWRSNGHRSRALSGARRSSQRRRRSRTSSTDAGLEPDFASNVVVSAKYTAFNFVPRVLLAQIKRPSNMYFLFIAVLQSIKEVSNTNGVPTILLPLTVVFICSMIKEALEDRERHRADGITNSRLVLVLSALGTWELRKWEDVCVGDIVKVRAGETLPADLFMLSAEEPHDGDGDMHEGGESKEEEDEGVTDCSTPLRSPRRLNSSGGILAYIETKSLDGETNLKIHSAIPLVSAISRSPSDLLELCGVIDCEAPNNRINSFDGKFSVTMPHEKAARLGLIRTSGSSTPSQLVGDHQGYQMVARADESVESQFPITSRQMLLRTCVLRNTTSVTGVVVFTGHETKVFCSNTEPTVKSSSVEKRLNSLIIGVVLIQQVVCGLGALLGALWMITNGDTHWYLKTHVHTSVNWNKGVSFPYQELLKLHLRYFIIMQNFVPISLNVSLEFVKYWQAYFMEQDLQMYDEPSDTRAMVRSSALNEDLGRVHHLFTDKTGTLTMNLMLFRYCMIGGKHYGGEISDKEMEAPSSPTGNSQPSQPRFVEFDPTDLFTDLHASGPQASRIELFLRHLALCHTLIPSKSVAEMVSDSVPEYSASSPDEQALVTAAAFCNVRFVHRTPSTMTLLEPGGDPAGTVYKIYHLLEFDSDRKRMSVVVETPTGEILLLCKGADNVILERLTTESEAVVDQVFDQLSLYAKAGMRTLCLAYKVIDPLVYRAWSDRFQAASSSMEELVKRRHGLANDMDGLMNEIEQDLLLIGVTAVQDKLQVGVPKTLELLQQTNIKVWTLTGDKMETAVNIGYACNLLSNKVVIKTVSCEDYVSTLKTLQEILVWCKQTSALARTTTPSKRAGASGSPKQKRRTLRQKTNKGQSDSWFSTFTNWFGVSNSPPQNPRRARTNHHRRRIAGQYSAAAKNDSDGDVEDEGDGDEYGSLLGSETSTQTGMDRAVHARGRARPQLAVALVIDGATLEFALRPRLRKLFYDVSSVCQSVICCRVSPKQKSDVVELVRELEPESVTLAIGDGANDVGMIQAAHVGVGISGQEGMQAVNASDYAIAQFRFLQRLLLVHGRWAYRRVTKLMSYMLYKNVTYVLTTFWFGTFSGFSGQPLIIDIAAQSFNVLYTSLPLVLFAVFDQDVSSKSAAAFPRLYALGQQNVLLRPRIFWPWILNGIWHSLVIFFISTWAFEAFTLACDPMILASDGKSDGIVTLGLVVFTNLVIVVNLKLCLETFLITWQFVATVSASIVAWFVVGNIIASPRSRMTHAVGELPFVQHLPSFWLVCLLVGTVSLMRDSIWKMLRRLTFPSTYHILQEREMLRLRNSPRSLQQQLKQPWDDDTDVQAHIPTMTMATTPQLVDYAKLLRTIPPFESEQESFRRSSPLAESLMSSSVRARSSFHHVDRADEDSELVDPVGRYEGPTHRWAEGTTSHRDEYHGYAFSEDENVENDVEVAAARSSSPRTLLRKQSSVSLVSASSADGSAALSTSTSSFFRSSTTNTAGAGRTSIKKMIKSVRGHKNA